MIKYGQFHFAAAPRTGTTWFLKVAQEVGLGEGSKTKVHIPPDKHWKGFMVTIVRHPYTWLLSYYVAMKGGRIGIPEVDCFSVLAKDSNDFEGFIAQYVSRCPGSVGKMFGVYQASTAMRLEDMPWATIEFFGSLRGKLNIDRVKDVAPQNVMKIPLVVINKRLRRKVVRAEEEFCERYEYAY